MAARLLERCGYVLVASGVLAFVLVDFMPVDAWQMLTNFVAGETGPTYFRVAPAEYDVRPQVLLVSLGVLLVAAARLWRKYQA